MGDALEMTGTGRRGPPTGTDDLPAEADLGRLLLAWARRKGGWGAALAMGGLLAGIILSGGDIPSLDEDPEPAQADTNPMRSELYGFARQAEAMEWQPPEGGYAVYWRSADTMARVRHDEFCTMCGVPPVPPLDPGQAEPTN